MKLRFLTLILLIGLPSVGSAQSFTASVRGVVTDSSHSAIPAAKVNVTDADRNVSQKVTTDASGRYAFTALPPGRYTLDVESAGFNKYSRAAFELQVQQQGHNRRGALRRRHCHHRQCRELGDIAEYNQRHARAGGGQQIYPLSLPLAGRAPLALVALSPGVTPSNLNPGGQSNTNFTANGNRNSSADVLLDGMSVANVEQNSGITNLEYQPSVDVVQEFKVQTNYFSSEFGNTGGAIVNVITKSGTNQLHGVGYEFYRNAALNANSWFSNRAGRAIPDFKRNVYGGTLGGPVMIPKVYDGHNKTFFFFDYEGSRQDSATTRTVSVPSLKEKAGDFSDTRAANGQLITIYNPFDTFKNASGATLRNPFAGNIVPKSMFSPIAVKALASYPDPTSDGNTFTHINNFFGQGVNQSHGNQIDGKIDHLINDRQRIMSRYSVNWGASVPAVLWATKLADPFSNGDSHSRTQNFVIDYTRMQSPSTLITLRYGILRQANYTDPKSLGFDQTSLGLSPLFLTSGVKMYPNFAPEGYQFTGQVGYGYIARGDDVNSFTGSVTKILGGHSLKAGAEARLMRLNYFQPGFPQGNFNFARATTSQDPNRGDTYQGNGIASMLIGWTSGASITSTRHRRQHRSTTAGICRTTGK